MEIQYRGTGKRQPTRAQIRSAYKARARGVMWKKIAPALGVNGARGQGAKAQVKLKRACHEHGLDYALLLEKRR